MESRPVCTCIALRKAARKVTALYDDALAPVGIGVAQYSLLRKIEDAGSPSLTELASRADLDRSTVGRNVRVLEKRGLVRFVPAPDQREAAVCLEPEGAALIAECRPLWSQAQARIEEKIGPEAVRVLRTVAAVL